MKALPVSYSSEQEGKFTEVTRLLNLMGVVTFINAMFSVRRLFDQLRRESFSGMVFDLSGIIST